MVLESFYAKFCLYLASHSGLIASAIISTALAVFGGDINKLVRSTIGGLNFFVRTAIFIFLCTVGYGLFSQYLEHLLDRRIRMIGLYAMPPLVFAAFCALGYLAQRKRQT